MSFHRIVLFALVAVLAAPSSAFAQDDDLLAPLTPQSKSSRSKTGKTKVVKKKPAREKSTKVTKKPAKPPRTKTARGKAGKKQTAPAADDDLLAPLAACVIPSGQAARPGFALRGAGLVLVGALLGFLIGMPEALLAAGEIQAGLARQMAIGDGRWPGQAPDPSLLLYGKTLVGAFGWPATSYASSPPGTASRPPCGGVSSAIVSASTAVRIR